MESADAAMSAKDLFAVAGALWAFFALMVFTLVKDVVLSERLPSLSARTRGWIKLTALVLMAVNFVSVGVFQTYGVWLARLEAKPPGLWPILCGISGFLLLGHLAGCFTAFQVLRTALNSAPVKSDRV